MKADRWLDVVRHLYVVLGIVNTVLIGAFLLIQVRSLASAKPPQLEGTLLHQLDFAAEDVFVVWYNSALLFLVAVLAVGSFVIDHSVRATDSLKWPNMRYCWLLLAAGTLFLSLDESLQLHEELTSRVDDVSKVLTGAEATMLQGSTWVTVLGPVLLVTAVVLLIFFVHWLARVPRARILAIVGIGCWVVVPVLEVVEQKLFLAKFGERGAVLVRSVEEPLELIGATLLVLATSEYLIARRELACLPRTMTRLRSGGIQVLLGSAAPIVLVPLAIVGLVTSPGLQRIVADNGYRYSADRVAMVMDNIQSQGHYLILSEGCDLARLQGVFAHEVRSAGSLATYPSGEPRRYFVEDVLTVLDHADGQSLQQVSAGLTRVAQSAMELWHLRPSNPSESDLFVEEWLSKHFTDVETLWLPGNPALQLTHVTPRMPLRLVEAPPLLDEPLVFGDNEVELVGYECSEDSLGDTSVLRVTLYWQAPGTVKTDYHVFVHLMDGAGQLVAQSDGMPGYDRYPFTAWSPNEIVVDCYDVPVPTTLERAKAGLYVGLYDFATGVRLPCGESDHATLRLSGTS